jgi:subtilisin family serine protease
VRQKPDFVGPDGGNDTFLGYTLASDGFAGGKLNTTIAACQNNPSYPNFFGTSAATPHVASIAALMLQANPALTPTEIFQALRTSALPMTSTTPNYSSGYGLVQADAAFALIPQVVPAVPTAASAGSGHSGGGALDVLALLGLAGMGFARILRLRPCVLP